MDFAHTSVLLEETVAALVTDPAGIYVDCTLGGAGHALAVTGRLSPRAWFIGIDQDPAAIRAAQARLATAACRVSVVRASFRDLAAVLDELAAPPATAILFDLGVSSHQLDTAARGFSYMHDGPLDMRMNPDDPLSARDIVNTWDEARLADIIFRYGEDKFARRIARAIVAERARSPLDTTGHLADTIKSAIPAAARREGPHPAKRTFQAIRIAVNDELGILRAALETAVKRLAPGGRLGVITFHSLEDRIAKKTIADLAKGCICPRDFPVCICRNTPKLRSLGKPVPPSAAELADNPRARSAKLRVAEKV